MDKRKLLKVVLGPVVEFALRNAMSLQEFSEVSKSLFVQNAKKEIEASGKAATDSGISIMTGIRRGDVAKYSTDEPESSEPNENVASRVLGQWQQDRRFRRRDGTPKVLTYKGKDNEFSKLVKTVSKHVHPTSVLSELERQTIVERSPRGLKIKKQTYSYGYDTESGFDLLSRNIRTMIIGTEENMFNKQPISNLHLRTSYDNIVPSRMHQIRQWFINEGKDFHRRAREFLSQYDKDITPGLEEEGTASVVLGAFSLTSESEASNSSD